MVVVGIILALVGVGGGAVLAWLALGSASAVTLGTTGLQLTVLPVTLFAAGAASMLLLWLGAKVTAAGARRRAAQRRQLRELRSQADARPAAPPPPPRDPVS